MKKILVVRFSSIGDIVLTSPVVRALYNQGGFEIHYLTKRQYVPMLAANPYISKLHSFESSIKEIIPELRSEKYDLVVDLHRNIRSSSLLLHLRRPFRRFKKLNIRKWILVNFKWNLMPDLHVVDRYMATMKGLIHDDGQGLDYFIPEHDQVDIASKYPLLDRNFHCITVGSLHSTKQIPADKITQIIGMVDGSFALLGGKEDWQKAENIRITNPNKVHNLCGEININQSASIIYQSNALITSDTGLMHIACALKKRVISVWGSTVLEFGMSPYLPTALKDLSTVVQVLDLKCRPCSKLGFDECPKGHFKCMNDIEVSQIASSL